MAEEIPRPKILPEESIIHSEFDIPFIDLPQIREMEMGKTYKMIVEAELIKVDTEPKEYRATKKMPVATFRIKSIQLPKKRVVFTPESENEVSAEELGKRMLSKKEETEEETEEEAT
jgi:hypothetical protein